MRATIPAGRGSPPARTIVDDRNVAGRSDQHSHQVRGHRALEAPVALGLLHLPGSGALATLSKDDGQTWKTVRVPNATGFLGDEWDVLQLDPSRLVDIFRNSHSTSDGTFWKSESRDGGQTWSVPRATNVRSHRHNSPA